MDMEKLNERCQKCSHRQNFDNVDRCCRLHGSVCNYVYDQICKDRYFMHINKGLSLYALEEWLKRLSQEEKDLPLGVELWGKELLVKFVYQYINKYGHKWLLLCKYPDDE